MSSDKQPAATLTHSEVLGKDRHAQCEGASQVCKWPILKILMRLGYTWGRENPSNYGNNKKS